MWMNYNFRSGEICFRHTETLETFRTISVTPHVPGAMCTVGPYVLYSDRSKEPEEIHWLELRDGRPRPAAEKRSIHTQQHYVLNMCVVQNGDQQLLVVAGHGLFTYNTKTGQRLEQLFDGFDGIVATDGSSHLFVCDLSSECIQIFSMSDRSRSFIECFKKSGHTTRIRWCEKSLSLFCIVDCKGCKTLQALDVQY